MPRKAVPLLRYNAQCAAAADVDGLSSFDLLSSFTYSLTVEWETVRACLDYILPTAVGRWDLL